MARANRLPLTWMVARRLLLRERQAPRRWRWWILGLCLLAAGTAATLLGVRSEIPPLVAGIAALALLGGACVRMLTPAVAVAVFGMSLGCAALITVFGVTSGFEHELTARLARVNGHILLTEYGQDFDEYPEVVATWGHDDRVAAVSPFAYAMAAVVPATDESANESAEASAEVSGEDHATAPLRTPAIALVKALDPTLASGFPGVVAMMQRGDLQALRPGDVRHLPGIALGHRLAARLDAGPGAKVRLVIPAELGSQADVGKPPRHATFEVLDVVDTGITDFDNSLALIHLTAGQALFFGKARVTGVEFLLHDPTTADGFADDLHASLGPDFHATTWRQQSEGTIAGLRQIRAVVALVLGLLELVAATALIASLLLLVRRKRAEIAALLCLGADGRAIFWIFEAVGLLSGVVGAAVGLGLGLLLSGLVAAYRYPLSGDVYPVDHLPVTLTPFDVIVPGLAAVILCTLVSGPVALVAAKQPLLAGLRR